MPNQKNQAQLEQIKDHFDSAKSIVVADYSGLNVAEQNELRAKLREAGGQMVVLKNRLFKLVAQDKIKANFDQLESELQGQNAFLFALEDAVSSLKTLFEFAEDHEALKIKIGVLEDKVLSYQETENLSKLPSKAELVAQLISKINGPAYGLVNVLQANNRNLVYALNAIKEQKQAN